MRFTSTGSVLCSHWPASISMSSSSDCSPEEPLVATIPLLSLPLGLTAEFGLLTDQSKIQTTKRKLIQTPEDYVHEQEITLNTFIL